MGFLWDRWAGHRRQTSIQREDIAQLWDSIRRRRVREAWAAHRRGEEPYFDAINSAALAARTLRDSEALWPNGFDLLADEE